MSYSARVAFIVLVSVVLCFADEAPKPSPIPAELAASYWKAMLDKATASAKAEAAAEAIQKTCTGTVTDAGGGKLVCVQRPAEPAK